MPAQALQRTRVDKNLVKRAVKSGLDDLKRKHRGVFLTPRALKVFITLSLGKLPMGRISLEGPVRFFFGLGP